MLKFEIIVTFEEKEQILVYINVPKTCTEENFIRTILKQLFPNEIKQLVKFSCCQMFCESENDLLPFIAQCNGKYYFNYNVNKDDITKKYFDFKQEFLTKARVLNQSKVS